jgi:hypothetical protein
LLVEAAEAVAVVEFYRILHQVFNGQILHLLLYQKKEDSV